MLLTKAEVWHIRDALENYEYLISVYPEVVTSKEEEQLAIALEIITHEDSSS